MNTTTALLDTILSPEDLRRLPPEDLPQVVRELRACLLENIAASGGHFASNLGVVELTVALHYVYRTPQDHLVWDVGHQAYAHKILTGRRAQMPTIRKSGGLAPFPKRDESVYDAFGTGHSSTSIGAALGMAAADKLSGSPARAVAVIGDGAMTAGQAFEALNNAGGMRDVDLLVVLNDNAMSISQNVGALPKYLARNMMDGVKDLGKQMLSILPGALDAARQVKSTLKDIVHPAFSLFDNFGFTYSGPADGHDVLRLVEILRELRRRSGPQFLHVVTRKGKGFFPAERDPVGFHAVGSFDADNPPQCAAPASAKTYAAVFGKWLCDQAAADERLIGITPAMCEGSGLGAFAAQFPARYFDVGIAEQHAVTFAAGLACAGKKPVVAVYSTFLQRGYDQWIHDVCLQNLPVLLAVDRAGIVGADGATHAGAYDLSFLRCLPNMTLAAPSDENECRLLLSACYALDTPAAVRYPRGTGTGAQVSDSLDTVEIGRGVVRRRGGKIALIAFGSMVAPALAAAEKLDATVADMRFVKPLDETLLRTLAAEHDYLVTLEENAVAGGAGSAVLEYLAASGCLKPLLQIGIADTVTEHGDAKEILRGLGLDAASVERRIRAFAAQDGAAA